MHLQRFFAAAGVLASLAIALPASGSTSSSTTSTRSHTTKIASSSLVTESTVSATSTTPSPSTATSTTTAATSTHSSNPDPPFQIRHLTIHKHVKGNTTIRFKVHDPSEYGRATTQCNATWATGSHGYPQTTYESCTNDDFAWNMMSFTSIYSFQLGIEHEYIDPLVGTYPYDIVDNFASANVSESTMACTTEGSMTVCLQHEHGLILAPVYASIA